MAWSAPSQPGTVFIEGTYAPYRTPHEKPSKQTERGKHPPSVARQLGTGVIDDDDDDVVVVVVIITGAGSSAGAESATVESPACTTFAAGTASAAAVSSPATGAAAAASAATTPGLRASSNPGSPFACAAASISSSENDLVEEAAGGDENVDAGSICLRTKFPGRAALCSGVWTMPAPTEEARSTSENSMVCSIQTGKFDLLAWL